MQQFISAHIERSIQTKQELLKAGVEKIEAAGFAIANAFEKGHKVLLCGNGGSASDAQHIATEFLIRYKSENIRPALPAISLAADSSAITACGNDFGFDQLFARQIEGLGQKDDVLVAISTSGNSENIYQALKVAKSKGLKTILLTGKTGGKILKEHSELLDHTILVPATETSRIQECHIMIGQIFCAITEKHIYNLD